VDDHAVVRFGIAQLINRQSDLVVCGEEEDARKARMPSPGSRPISLSPTCRQRQQRIGTLSMRDNYSEPALSPQCPGAEAIST